MPVTALREMVLRAGERDVPTLILVLGDYDPAGRYIRERVDADIEAFADEEIVAITVETVALTEDQVEALGLIRAPMDARKRRKYPSWPHDWTVELEAVSPADLAAIVSEAIEDRTDAETRQAVLEREQEERDELMRQLDENDEGER
jgi:hypothetical protein